MIAPDNRLFIFALWTRRGAPLCAALSIAFGTIFSPAWEARAESRVKKLQEEIEQLSRELESIKSTESGILGELRKLESERKLREAELQEISLIVAETEARIAEGERAIDENSNKIEEARDYLSRSLRELYKLGKLRHYRILLSAQSSSETLLFFKYASYLAAKDAGHIRLFRNYLRSLYESKRDLDLRRKELLEKKQGLENKKEMLLRGESSRRALLTAIRNKKEVHHEAISELRNACDELEKLIHSFGSEREANVSPSLNARKFKGLFSWPSRGEVSVPFGLVKHTKFGTEFPHNGIDIAASPGADIRAVFDGKVLFAEWFKGYGLTIILDHGSGILSVYAHTSAILVEVGEEVIKGSLVGKVGDSGSLKGPYLYFEIRDRGRAADPVLWLSER